MGRYNNGKGWDSAYTEGVGLTPEAMDAILEKNKPKLGNTRPQGGGGGGSYSPPHNPYADYLDQIKRMREEQLAQQKAQAQGRYDNRVKEVNTGADEILRQAYVSKMQDSRQLPQQLKALGISGGASESTLQNMTANYANNRNSTEAQRAQAISEAAQDRDSMTARAYSDFLENKISALQTVGLQAAQQEARQQEQQQATAQKYVTSKSAKARGTTYITEGGQTFTNINEWVTYKRSQGYSDDQIAAMARKNSIIS